MIPTLTLARSEATARLRGQIAEGQRFLSLNLTDHQALAAARCEKSAWSLRNRQLLYRLFEDQSGITGYGGTAPLSQQASVGLQTESFRMEVRAQLNCLEALLGRLS